MRNRLLTSLLLFLILIGGGTLGYMTLTEADFFDALYMTIISVTTVGYGETISMRDNPSARAFTMFLLLNGMGITLYFASILTAFLVEGELRELLWSRKMRKEIERLSNHIIIVGGGQTAYYAIQELLHLGHDFVVVEKSQAHFNYLQEHFHGRHLLGILGDATDDEILIQAGIKRARGLMSTLPEDRDNVFVTISARGLNPNIHIIAKIVQTSSASKVRMAGANEVVCPDSIGGLRMVSQLIRPHVVSFMDTMLRVTDETVRIEEIQVSEKECIGKSVMQLNLPGRFGNLLVLALRPKDSEFPQYNPKDAILQDGDTLIVMGHHDWIQKAREHLA